MIVKYTHIKTNDWHLKVGPENNIPRKKINKKPLNILMKIQSKHPENFNYNKIYIKI